MAAHKNLDIYCEFGDFVISSLCRVWIDLKRDPETGKFKFVSTIFDVLAAVYSKNEDFFEQIHDVLVELCKTEKSSHHRFAEDTLSVSAWLLEMRHRDLNMQPRRHALVTTQLVHRKVIRQINFLVAAHLPPSENGCTNVLYVVRIKDVIYHSFNYFFEELLGRTPDIITYDFIE